MTYLWLTLGRGSVCEWTRTLAKTSGQSSRLTRTVLHIYVQVVFVWLFRPYFMDVLYWNHIDGTVSWQVRNSVIPGIG